MKICHRCGHDIQILGPVGRSDTCLECRAELKVCLNCRMFDPGAANQCREPHADPVHDKEKANFCEFFVFRETSALGLPGHGGAQSERDQARSTFDALFRKK